MKVVHHGHLRRDLVPIKAFGKNRRSLGPKDPLTTAALLMVKTIENLLGLRRLTLDHRPRANLFES
jgi:hypothetical protein